MTNHSVGGALIQCCGEDFQPYENKNDKTSTPMEIILNTYGTSLSRDSEGFVVTTSEGRQRIPAEGVSSIQMGRGAQITSDAVLLAIEREITVVFTDKSGKPLGRVWSPKYGSISTIRKGQLNFARSKDAVKWIKDELKKKIENQQTLLLMMKCDAKDTEGERDASVEKLEGFLGKMAKIEGESVRDVAQSLRGLEGMASKVYFKAMNLLLPEEYRFAERSQHPALDVSNAMLNYGYGMMYGKIEGDMIKAGIDPYIGVLHRDEYNRPVLVYDVIEQYRVWIDYVVVSLLCQKVVTDEYYSHSDDGSVWLEQMGRRVLIQSVNDYLGEVVTMKGVTRSRENMIFLYVQDLAQKFKKYESL